MQLKNHFDEVIFITNKRELDTESTQFLFYNNIELKQVVNKGLDFGMYWNIIPDLDMNLYQSLALVNDSCYLFKELDNFFEWYDKSNLDVAGFTDCYIFNHHIQSYFLIYSKDILEIVKQYFIKYGVINNRQEVINTYEVGLCKYLSDQSFKIGAMYPNTAKDNINRMLDSSTLSEGIPLMKRKTFHLGDVDYRKIIDNPHLIPNNVVVYQIYYDKPQIITLSRDTIPYFNNKLTVYFENSIIRNSYDKITGDYFGILSWKFVEKNKLEFKSDYIDGKHDIYIFNPVKEDVLHTSQDNHPFFNDIFNVVLRNLKISNKIRPTLGLYTNSVIAKSHIYRKYIDEYLIPTMDILDNICNDDTDRVKRILKKKLWSDSNYVAPGNNRLAQRLKEHTGKPYYTYHSFICERLWTVFYELHKDEFKWKIINYPKSIS